MTTLSVIGNGDSAGVATAANTTQYWPVSGTAYIYATVETQMQITFRAAGTLQNMYLRLQGNSCNGTTTYSTRKNAAAGNQTISVATVTTGEFEDLTHTDTVVAADKLDIQSLPAGGSTGTNTINVMGLLYNTTTNTATLLAATNWSSLTPGLSTTVYNTVNGFLIVNTTEANAKCRQRLAGTYQYLFLNLASNGRTTTTTWNSRLNGANGALTVSVTSAQTGIFEDTTHTDTVAPGDDYDIAFTTGASSETFLPTSQAVTFISTAGYTYLLTGNASAITMASSASTIYNTITGGFYDNEGTESSAQRKMRDKYMFRELNCRVTTNTCGTAGTLRLRKNTANANMVASVTANTTGVFSDSVNTDAIVVTDEVNYSYFAATNSSTVITNIACWAVKATSTPFSETTTISDATPKRLIARKASPVFAHTWN